MLQAGGNAVDAAVAATFAAWVSEPVLTGPFGGGFAMVAGAKDAPVAYGFFADVPGRGLCHANEQDGLDFAGVEVSFGPTTQVFHVGRGSVAMSALLPGLVGLHRDHGSLPISRVVAPAVLLAEEGVPLSSEVAPILEILRPILSLTPQSRALFAPQGELLRAGESFVNPDLANLLRCVGEGCSQVPRDALLQDFAPPAGRITLADLDALAVRRAAPIQVDLNGYELNFAPPPSSGGVLVAFGLRLLEAVPKSIWSDDVQAIQHIYACMTTTVAARRAGLDDAIKHGGDEVVRAAEKFLSDAFIDSWREPFERMARGDGDTPAAWENPLGSTTHVSVLDSTGMACSITSSNGEGSGHVIGGTGAMANNFLGEEDLHPGGFHNQRAGMRLASMMCPTVVKQDGKPILTLGTGGSNRIRTAILQVLVGHLLRGQTIDQAVRAPRIHFDGQLYIEAKGPGTTMPTAVITALTSRVPDAVVFDAPNMFFGGVHAAGRGHGAGDPRRGGQLRTL